MRGTGKGERQSPGGLGIEGETNKRNFPARARARYDDSHIPRFACTRGCVDKCTRLRTYNSYAPVISIYFTIGCIRAASGGWIKRGGKTFRRSRAPNPQEDVRALRVNKLG